MNDVHDAGHEQTVARDEVEALAKLAYETYMADAYRDGSVFPWERLNAGQQQHWRASTSTVMNTILCHVKPSIRE